ncbi:MAG: hypothetical protein EPO13_10505 [Actinomycetota bacterium]|nr:MAG: hypothetical protein EPO13_10505 [Actinomycetota bacterium]
MPTTWPISSALRTTPRFGALRVEERFEREQLLGKSIDIQARKLSWSPRDIVATIRCERIELLGVKLACESCDGTVPRLAPSSIHATPSR